MCILGEAFHVYLAGSEKDGAEQYHHITQDVGVRVQGQAFGKDQGNACEGDGHA